MSLVDPHKSITKYRLGNRGTEDCTEDLPALLSGELLFCSKFPVPSKQRTLGVYHEHEALLEANSPSGESAGVTGCASLYGPPWTRLTSFCLPLFCLFSHRALGASDVPGARPQRYNFSSPRAWSRRRAHKERGHFFQRCFYLKRS